MKPSSALSLAAVVHLVASQGTPFLQSDLTTTTTPSATISSTSTAPPLGPSPTSWDALGCYDPLTRSPDDNILEQNMNPDGDSSLTIPKCQNACYRAAYKFAGVHQGNQCWCSDIVGGERARNQNDCNVPCAGDKSTSCGGTEAFDVFIAVTNSDPTRTKVPLRIVVTNRPELHIRLGFREMLNGTYQDLVLHEVLRITIEHDIRLFLEHELSAIQKERRLALDWPATQQILALVELAVPLFIYAATVCRYVGTKGGDPKEYLNKVLQYPKAAFSQLDRTYLPVLDQLLGEQEERDREDWLQVFRGLVGSIVILESPLSIGSLARLLQVSRKQVKRRLDALHSVLSIPNGGLVPIRILHLSFREFLIDPQKQGKSPFWVDEKSTHIKLASRCLKLMSSQSGLRQDMCSLVDPGVLRSEINNGTVASSLPPKL
ncbi:hypothetical protein BDW02DRAFT_584119 [Decorospora gaudefroyi]|uniref:WSC domain-containing protein n=1 Tax=Decorospora gaudefroyi TaxID=184978 RepID=A0A6A5JWF2_9PLEO|nr:hypothetical protein BDW02DRAFT_584119 [Decorospora gaudefroyi]